LEDIAAVKEKAISIPWLSGQATELVKVYFNWLSICRLAVEDWDEETEEDTYLQLQLEECFEKIGTSTTHTQFPLIIAFDNPDHYLLGKLAIQIKTLSNREDEAKNIWNLMSKANASKCNYWLDRIAWER
jgi:hypothetical protein